MDNLALSMAEKPPLLSEGEELESFLAELAGGAEIKEIAGLASGFANLDRSLDGFLPGLYLLVGPPSCGKSAFAKQLLDQVASRNSIPAIFFGFAESKKDLRIRTLARLSGLEEREILRGSSYLLHWYGVPKGGVADPERMPPGWEKLQRTAAAAKNWLDLIYLSQGDEKTDFKDVAREIQRVKGLQESEQVMVVIDDSQRLGGSRLSLEERFPLVTEQLQGLAVAFKTPILATWPDLKKGLADSLPYQWAERAAGADVILVMEEDAERMKKLTEPRRAIKLHIVKNRRGEKGPLAFDFMPAFSQFAEALSDSSAL